MNEMFALDNTGDTKTIWNPENPDEVEAAKSTFDKLIGKGYRAFKVNKEGETAARLTTFDPLAGKMILVPQIVGG